MRNRGSHPRHSIEQLRLAIDCLPVATREAMLEGVRASERVIAGAYVDELGGVCPMLAAHRRGGRTDFLSFAKSWDRFTRAARMRPATARELTILISHLEASLLEEDGLQLEQAIAEHRELRGRRLSGARRLLRLLDPTGEIVARRARSARCGEDAPVMGDNPAPLAERGAPSPVAQRG